MCTIVFRCKLLYYIKIKIKMYHIFVTKNMIVIENMLSNIWKKCMEKKKDKKYVPFFKFNHETN
jgi:hypothetical protein